MSGISQLPESAIIHITVKVKQVYSTFIACDCGSSKQLCSEQDILVVGTGLGTVSCGTCSLFGQYTGWSRSAEQPDAQPV